MVGDYAFMEDAHYIILSWIAGNRFSEQACWRNEPEPGKQSLV